MSAPPPTWKKFEAWVCSYLGGKRRGADTTQRTEDGALVGQGYTDCLGVSGFAVEVKYGDQAMQPANLRKAVEQVQRAASSDEVPIVVTKKKGWSDEDALVVMSIQDLRDWFVTPVRKDAMI